MPRRVTFATLAPVVLRAARGKRVVGFDVFDTLLRRRVEPEAVKDAAARALAAWLDRDDWRALRAERGAIERRLYEERAAAGRDGEFHLREVAERWVAGVRPVVPEAARSDLAGRLVAHEIELEHRAQEATPGIADALAALRARGHRLVFVSDMYFGATEIAGFLAGAGLAGFFDAGYASCEHDRRKTTGRLFERVFEHEGVRPQEFLFVGNTLHVDVMPVRRLGGTALHVVDPPEHKRRLRLEVARWAAERRPLWRGHLAREVVASIPRRVRAGASPAYDLGLVMALPFAAFALHVLRTAERRGLREVYFLSREGWLFHRLYRRLRAALPCAPATPRGRYLFASRLATYLPSMQRLDWPELYRMWRQYERQSPRMLLGNLSLPTGEFAPLLRACGFDDLDRSIEDPEHDPAFRRFLTDPEVQERFRAHRDAARARLRAYLEQIGVLGGGEIAFVDIGWKASMQTNVCRAFAGDPAFPRVHGLYFALIAGPDTPPAPTTSGFIADTRAWDAHEGTVVRCFTPFEFAATALHGSVVGYEAPPGRGGRIVPQLRSHRVEEAQAPAVREAMAAVDDHLADLLHAAPLLDLDLEALRACAVDQLVRYVRYPSRRESAMFTDYAHVESFGGIGLTRLEWPGLGSMLRAGTPRRILDACFRAVDHHVWPGLVLRRAGVPGGQFAYDLWHTLRTVR